MFAKSDAWMIICHASVIFLFCIVDSVLIFYAYILYIAIWLLSDDKCLWDTNSKFVHMTHMQNRHNPAFRWHNINFAIEASSVTENEYFFFLKKGLTRRRFICPM